MSATTVLAYFFAVICIGAAIYVAVSRHVLKTLIAFCLQLTSAGGLLLSLEAEYLALVVLAVALLGTVLVTAFSSVIMGNLKAQFRSDKRSGKDRIAAVFGMALGLAMGAAMAAAFLSKPFVSRLHPEATATPVQAIDVHVFGRMMLGQQVMVFEVLAILVLVVTIGAGLLLRKQGNER